MKNIIFVTLLLVPGSLVSAAGRPIDAASTRVFGRNYAVCIVHRGPADARKAVLRRDNAGSLIKLYPKLNDPACLLIASQGKLLGKFAMKFSSEALLHNFADALFKQDFADDLPVDVSGAAVLQHDAVDETRYLPQPNEVGTTYAEARAKARLAAHGRFALSRFGECVVRRDHKMAHSLLKADPATPAEAEAFSALDAVFTFCRPELKMFKANETLVRGTVAMNYYRLASSFPTSVAEPVR